MHQADKHHLEAYAKKERRFSSVEADLLRKFRPEMHFAAEQRGKDEYAIDRWDF